MKLLAGGKLSSKQIKIILCLVTIFIAVVVLIYFLCEGESESDDEPQNFCSSDIIQRIQCGKSQDVTLHYCNSINCCFDSEKHLCFHYDPSRYYYYRWNYSSEFYQRSLDKSPFQRDLVQNLQISLNEIDENNLEITLHDANVPILTHYTASRNYVWDIDRSLLKIQVSRRTSSDVLFTSLSGPTIASENYWEWTFRLTDQYLFGLGQTLIEVEENSTFTKVIYSSSKDHNTIPAFMAYKKGKYHGLLIQNSGPLEITVYPTKIINLKSLTNDKIVLKLSVGPTIQDVMAQQRQKKYIPNVSLETLGIHLCRSGSTVDLENILSDYDSWKKNFTASFDAHKFDYASDCIHENLIMALRNENDGSNIAKLLETITSMSEEGHRFTLFLPPQVPLTSDLYKNSKSLNAFYKTALKEDYRGQFFDDEVAYPYFGHPEIDNFIDNLLDELKGYFGELWPKNFVLSYNWPSDDSFEMGDSSKFQYLSSALKDAMSSTLPWYVTSSDEEQYLVHNNYGALHMEKLKSVLQAEDTLIMTASQNLDILGPQVIENVDISWTSLRRAMETILFNSIFGNPLTAVPVCGTTSNFNVSHRTICERWYWLAATAPIFLITSDLPRRDPVSLPKVYSSWGTKYATDFRYSIKYYLYSVLNSSQPLMRPLFYDFPDDNETFPIVEQFMIGENLMMVHYTSLENYPLHVYLPKSSNWYKLYTFSPHIYTGWITLNYVVYEQIAFIREGAVIPLVYKDVDDDNTESVELRAGLKCAGNDTECEAKGSMIIGHDVFTFTCNETDLTIERKKSDLTKIDKKFVLNTLELFRVYYAYHGFVLNLTTGEKGKDLFEIDDTWSYYYKWY